MSAARPAVVPAGREIVAAPPAFTLEPVACNLCGADDARPLYRKPDTRFWISRHVFDVVRCRRCGLGYVDPRPTPETIGVFYPPSFFDGRGLEPQRRRYAAQAAYVEARAGGRLLDVGCAGGAFVRVMRDRGWDAEGMDRFDGGNPFAVPVRHGDLPDLGYEDAAFDVVTAWGVFEHLHDPMAYFREVRRILRPGGTLVCLVTNLRSVWSRFAFAEDVPRHLHFFSPPTLDGYARAVGLRLDGVDHAAGILAPDSTDVFRIRLLRRLGVDWREVYTRGGRPAVVRAAERAARLLGRLLFGGGLEARCRISGVIVAVMTKPAGARS